MRHSASMIFLTQSVATSCHKNESHGAFDYIKKYFFKWLYSAKLLCKEKLLAYGISMVKISRLSTKLGLLSWWFLSLYTRGPTPMGAWAQPSVTNDHHLWSLHKGKLWRSLQHMLQIDPMSRQNLLPIHLNRGLNVFLCMSIGFLTGLIAFALVECRFWAISELICKRINITMGFDYESY